KLDVRWIAATNKKLEVAIKSGEFREDLFYRLNVYMPVMPPLRERRDDIPLLAAYFAVQQTYRCVRGISPAARVYLQRYDWPGNVRELANVIEYAVGTGSTQFIMPDDLPDHILHVETASRESIDPPEQGISTEPIVVKPEMMYHEAVKDAKKQIVIKA